MTRLKQFINEEMPVRKYSTPRSKKISEMEAKDIILKKCKKSMELEKRTGIRLIRGTKESGDFLFSQPSKGQPRKSANTENYITLLVDHILPSWKNYPDRSKSLVCHTNKKLYFNSVYGSTTYAVFPFDDSSIGICPDDDWWGSFDETLYPKDVPGFNTLLEELFGLNDNITYQELKKILNTVTPPLDSKTFKSFTKGNFLTYLDVLLSPIKNNFKLIKTGGRLPTKIREAWTDGDSILIHNDVFEMFFNSISDSI